MLFGVTTFGLVSPPWHYDLQFNRFIFLPNLPNCFICRSELSERNWRSATMLPWKLQVTFGLGQKCWVVSLFERKGRCWEEKRARYYSRNILYVRIWAMQWTNHSISSSFWSVTQSLLRAYKVTIYHVREDPNTFHMTSKSIISIWK